MNDVRRFDPSGARRVTQSIGAEFPTLQRAEDALSALEWAGIEAANITLAGPAVQFALARTDTETRDARLARKVAGMSLLGLMLGALAGFFAGGIAALILSQTVWSASGYDHWLATGLGALLGGVAGAVIGAMIGGESALNISIAAELKYEDVPPEPAIVEVSTLDPVIEVRAETILRNKRPRRMWRTANGRIVPAA